MLAVVVALKHDLTRSRLGQTFLDYAPLDSKFIVKFSQMKIKSQQCIVLIEYSIEWTHINIK